MKHSFDLKLNPLIQNLATHIKISDAIKKLLSTVVDVTAIEKGAILVKEGNSCNELFYLNSGLFRSFYTRENGNEVTSSFIQKNEFFTNVKGFINSVKSTESFEALENSSICRIKRNNYWKIMSENPILSPINSQIINNHRIELEERIKMLQCLTAKEKYLFFESNYPKLINHVQLSHIASFLGIRLETLSRIRKNLLLDK